MKKAANTSSRQRGRFLTIWDHTKRPNAETAWQRWQGHVTPERRADFKPLVTAMTNWHDEIFNYFENPMTNAYTESPNNLTRAGPNACVTWVKSLNTVPTFLRWRSWQTRATLTDWPTDETNEPMKISVLYPIIEWNTPRPRCRARISDQVNSHNLGRVLGVTDQRATECPHVQQISAQNHPFPLTTILKLVIRSVVAAAHTPPLSYRRTSVEAPCGESGFNVFIEKSMRYIRRLSCFLVLTAATCMANAATSGSGSIVQLGFRASHRCVLHSNGAVDCVSESPYLGGPLGDAPAYRPVRMIARGATQLSVGGFASCAVVAGALDCWRGLPATGKPATAPEHLIAAGVTDVSVGDNHACVVANGAARCWGRDAEGQIGHSDGDFGDGPEQLKPWPVIAKGVTRVAAGSDMSCAVAAGALWCWGNTRLANDPGYGKFHRVDNPPPVRVFARDVSAVTVGRKHVCAVVHGALWCWGNNSHGQVGLGYSRDHAQHSPNFLPWNPKNGKEFRDGDQACIAQWQDIACRVDHPVMVIAYGVTDVFARDDETCALASGALMCWGDNWDGQLGMGSGRQSTQQSTMGGWKPRPGITSDQQDVLKPTVAIPYGVSFVALNASRTCAVMKGGTLSCTLLCTKDDDALKCPAQPAFVAGDPNDMSGIEARVGVWRGSIGDSKVMVCLERPDTFNDSMYYYLRHRFSLALRADGNSGVIWNEAPPNQRTPDWSKPAAVWTLQAPVGNRMEGTWAAADGSRKAPIVLARVAAATTRGGCDGAAFETPRVASQKLDIRESGGFRYTSALNGQVSMTEIPDALPHAVQINASTRAWFASQITGYYDCAFSNFDRKPDSSYNETSEIDLLAPPWLVTRERYSSFCGLAHPSSGTSYTIWNLDTGKTVDPWDFIANSHWDSFNKVYHCDDTSICQRMPPPALKAILAKHFKHDSGGDNECDGALDAWPGYTLHPEKDGLVFSTDFAFVEYACNDDIKLSWKTLAPFLTPQGKNVMRSLHQGR